MLAFNFNPFPVFTTERFILRAPELSDAEEMFRHRTDKEINKYIQRPKVDQTVEDTRALLERVITGIENNETIFWMIVPKGASKTAGNICLWNVNKETHRGELGYSLDTKFHSLGIMTEVTALVLDYAFNTMKLDAIDAYTHRDNTASRRLLERKGFIRNPELEAKHVGSTDPETSVIYTLHMPVK